MPNFVLRFRNLKDMRFNEDVPSGDYSLQLMIGYNNFRKRQAGRMPLKHSLQDVILKEFIFDALVTFLRGMWSRLVSLRTSLISSRCYTLVTRTALHK